MKSKLAVLVVALVCLCGSAKADGVPECSASTLSALMGTTCAIGNLQFAFNRGFSVSAPWSTSNFFFTPVQNGFTIRFDGGPQSVTSPQFETESASFLAVFDYSVTVLDGYGISSESVTGGAISASGSSALAEYGALTNQNPFEASDYFFAFRGGTTRSSANASFPIRSGVGEVILIQLDALGGGGGTASWDGSPDTVTYGEVFVPEPASLVLLIVGLVCLSGYFLLRNMPNMRMVRN